MSPYPVQTDRATILETARALIERAGVESLSLAQLASELGIKAPSLYRHIASKNALLKAVIEQTYMNLFRTYDEAFESASNDPKDQLLRIAQAHRGFVQTNPNTYMLAFTTQNPELRTNPDILLDRAVFLQQIIAQISGQENSHPALRGLLAIVHGYVMLELNEQLQRGGDLSATFDAVVNAYLRGWL